MSLKINDACISCGTCLRVCKNGAIKKRNEIFTINPDRCTECVGWYEISRCVDSCLLFAIEPDPLHQESHPQLLKKWRKLHPGKSPYAT